MNPIIEKTFGGLSFQYYIRNFLFGLIFPVLIISILLSGEAAEITFPLMFSCIVNTVLYPYSRFVYESVIGFIVGDNFFITDGLVFMITKIMSMAFCWAAALFIAPVGLVYLYFYHSKNETE